MSIPLLSYSIYITSIYITLIYFIYYVAFLVASGCVCISLSLVFNSRTRTKNPFGGPLKSAFGSTRIAWVMRKGLRYVLRAILLPLERTNGRPDHSERIASALFHYHLSMKKKNLSNLYHNNLRVAGEGDFHLSPLFFFFFSFFFFSFDI